MIVSWPPTLVAEIARRRSVVFLGAGISMACKNANGQRPKSWSQLLNAATAAVPGPKSRKTEIRKIIHSGDYLMACEVIRELMGTHQFHTFLTNELLTPNYQPAPIHDSIIQLGSRIYATPNFDKIFEAKMSNLPHTAVRVKNYYDSDIAVVARGDIPVVLKVHGTIDAPDKMIFTRGDYARARTSYRHFYAILEALAITHTFLFIGCGLSDPDIRLLLEDHALTFPGVSPHCFVMKQGAVPKSILPTIEKNTNLQIITYSGDHDQLKPALDELVVEVNSCRSNMQVHRNW